MNNVMWKNGDYIIRTKQAKENNREHNTPSTTHVRIGRTHVITAE
jgi:hypothetical protein